MVGGRGIRISELFPDIPKPLIPFNNIPVLEHELCSLCDQGFTDFIVSTQTWVHTIKKNRIATGFQDIY